MRVPLTYITCPSEGMDNTASKSSSSVTAEPKIAPPRTDARLLNTLLQQHCSRIDTKTPDTRKQPRYKQESTLLYAYVIKDANQFRGGERRLLTADTAHIHGPVPALRQQWRMVRNPRRGRLIPKKTQGRNGQKGTDGKADRRAGIPVTRAARRL